MKKLICATAIAMALSACGGGDDGGTAASTPVSSAPSTPAPPVAATPAAPATPVTPAPSTLPLDAYIGTWTANCVAHERTTATITRAAGSTNQLSVSSKSDYYANENCTGAIRGTSTTSAPYLVTYVETKDGNLVNSPHDVQTPGKVDYVTITFPQRTVSVTGPGVTYGLSLGMMVWTIAYDNDPYPTILADLVLPAERLDRGFFLKGNEYYQTRLITSLTGSVDEWLVHYTRQ